MHWVFREHFIIIFDEQMTKLASCRQDPWGLASHDWVVWRTHLRENTYHLDRLYSLMTIPAFLITQMLLEDLEDSVACLPVNLLPLFFFYPTVELKNVRYPFLALIQLKDSHIHSFIHLLIHWIYIKKPTMCQVAFLGS